MSPIREIAIKMIQEIPEDRVVYILDIIKGINGLYDGPTPNRKRKLQALKHMQQFRGKIPTSIDYDDELAKARMGKYASTH